MSCRVGVFSGASGVSWLAGAALMSGSGSAEALPGGAVRRGRRLRTSAAVRRNSRNAGLGMWPVLGNVEFEGAF
jgi:hypothetical protein